MNKADYLEGELNAVKACGTAITEAVEAIKNNSIELTPGQSGWILIEFQGIMLRASMLIEEKNKTLGVLK